MIPRRVAVGLLLLATTSAVAAEGFEACLATRGDRVIADQASDRHMVPASVTKLVVAAAALHHLGADYRITTELAATAAPRDGTLPGDLVLRAAGDPTWSSRFFPDDPRAPLRQLAKALLDRGVRTVEGKLTLDLSAFPGRPFPPSRAIGELAFGWAAPTSALAIDDNIANLIIAPGSAVGEPAQAALARVHGLRIDNRMVTAPHDRHERGTVDVLPAWRGSTLLLRGEYPISEPQYRMEVAVPDPDAHVGRTFAASLEEIGIAFDGKVETSHRPVSTTVDLAAVRSPTLAEMLPPILRDSRNWHAEMLLRQLALAETGAGRTDDGLDLLIAFLEKTVGIAEGDVHLDDASGISPYNLATPRAMVHLLRFVLDQPWRDAFFGALARPGHGSLGGWPALPPALQAKTGTGRHTLGLAGIVPDVGDRPPLVFACLSNHRVDQRGAQRRDLATRVRRWDAMP